MNEYQIVINTGSGPDAFPASSWYNGLADYVRVTAPDGSITFFQRASILYLTIPAGLPHDNA